MHIPRVDLITLTSWKSGPPSFRPFPKSVIEDGFSYPLHTKPRLGFALGGCSMLFFISSDSLKKRLF